MRVIGIAMQHDERAHFIHNLTDVDGAVSGYGYQLLSMTAARHPLAARNVAATAARPKSCDSCVCASPMVWIMEALLVDEVIHTAYGQLDVVWADDGGFDGDPDRFFANQVNGLVGAGDPNGVYLNLGRRSGGSHVRMALLTTEPGDPGEQWEDVVEVSLVILPGREVRWMSWAGETSGQLGVPAGSYRLRVSARGRDAGAADEFADGVVDHYLLELWPASQQEDAVLRAGSENAEYWHAEWGGRR
jgi:hypothetical protein